MSNLFDKKLSCQQLGLVFSLVPVLGVPDYLLYLSPISHFYLHIPFCRQRCPYCKFALTPVFDEAKKRRYIAHLKGEIKTYFLSSGGTKDVLGTKADSSSRRNDKTGKNTIYFGGGTPSVLSHDELLSILEFFPDYRSASEITLESNPEDITEEYVRGLFELGVTRLSMGVQTVNDASLKEIHRSSKKRIYEALESIEVALLSSRRRPLLSETRYGSTLGVDPFQNQIGEKNNQNLLSEGKRDFSATLRNDEKSDISINIDFILGLPYTLPGETLEGIKELHKKFPFITHTSIYMLEDEKYPKHWKANSITEAEMQREFLEIMDYFESIGWHHYELSNFAKPGYESQHNQSYWDHSSYRGFGLSASSFDGEKRWTNSSSFAGYYRGEKEGEETLTEEAIKIENIMFSMRRDGVEKPLLEENKYRPLITKGFLEIRGEKLFPTKTGIFLLDHIIGELI